MSDLLMLTHHLAVDINPNSSIPVYMKPFGSENPNSSTHSSSFMTFVDKT
nr:MAG TPA: hypothetical protein [Caudoviricetes sp.]